jgi:hypothetical protein
MKLASMQPYFLPYLGYYSLIKCSDMWIVNDEVQMMRQGWIERNRILKQVEGWNYIRVPLVKHSHTSPIKNVMIRNDIDWKERIMGQISHYSHKTPYYNTVIEILSEVFSHQFESITQLNVMLLEKTCEYLGLDFNYTILSESNIDYETAHEPDEWALNLCKALGVDHYINPILGKSFYDISKYDKAGIKFNFLNWNPTPYDQGRDTFIEGLSIVDVMMFNSPEEINVMLDDYNLE